MVSSIIMLFIFDKIPKDSISLVRNKLEKLDKIGLAKILLKIPSLELKNVPFVFWIGSVVFGIFGIGRFMIGDNALGILKLISPIISIMSFLSSLLIFEPLDGYYLFYIALICGWVFLLASVIWWIIDMFLVPSKAKKMNLDIFLRIMYVEATRMQKAEQLVNN